MSTNDTPKDGSTPATEESYVMSQYGDLIRAIKENTPCDDGDFERFYSEWGGLVHTYDIARSNAYERCGRDMTKVRDDPEVKKAALAAIDYLDRALREANDDHNVLVFAWEIAEMRPLPGERGAEGVFFSEIVLPELTLRGHAVPSLGRIHQLRGAGNIDRIIDFAIHGDPRCSNSALEDLRRAAEPLQEQLRSLDFKMRKLFEIRETKKNMMEEAVQTLRNNINTVRNSEASPSVRLSILEIFITFFQQEVTSFDTTPLEPLLGENAEKKIMELVRPHELNELFMAVCRGEKFTLPEAIRLRTEIQMLSSGGIFNKNPGCAD